MPKYKLSAHKKILTLLVLVALVPLLLAALTNLLTIIKTRQQNIVELENFAIESTSEKINKYLSSKIENLNLVINTEPTNISQIDRQTLRYFLETMKGAIGTAGSIAIIDTEGNELLRNPDDGTLTNVANEEYFQAAKNGQKYYGQVFYQRDQKLMRLSAPIANSKQMVIGVVAALVDLSEINTIVSQAQLGKAGYLLVVDSAGSVIFQPEQQLGQAALASTSAGSLILAGATGNYLTYREQGQEIIIDGRKLETADWLVVSKWPKTDAFAVVNHLLLQSLIISIITMLLVVVISFLAARRIVKPIKTLIGGIDKISAGNLDDHIDLKTNDEFELLGDQFNRMIELLKENQHLKDEFVFIAAHELRTPVTAVKGYVSMLIEGIYGELQPEVKKTLEIVYSANERLVQLVQDLLEVARSESGKMAIAMSPVSLNETIKAVSAELLPLAEQKGLKLLYEEPKENIMVLADLDKLKEVLINIIGNAIKYTVLDQSGLEVGRVKNIDIFQRIEGEKIYVHIKDHGLGMSKEAAEKLFTKFYRVKTDQTAKIEGTGLGLFICKEIIERMGGSIVVESVEGEGSDFIFSLNLSA